MEKKMETTIMGYGWFRVHVKWIPEFSVPRGSKCPIMRDLGFG